MKELGRNDPCPCGSGKKVKKCCPERLEKPSPAALPPSPSRVPRPVLASRSHLAVPRDAQAWPVVRAYVPMPDVWRATGLGTAGFVRQQPDGQVAYAFFLINLLEHGLTGMFGKDDATLADLDSMMAALADKCPPMQEGPPEMAAQFIWGALAVAESEAQGFPAGQTASYLALVPRLPGTVQTWRARLLDDDSVTPQGLVRVIRANGTQDEVPEGKEVMILTEMTFDMANAATAKRALRGSGPDFDEAGRDGKVAVFDWTREYPKGHWSPLSRLGGRQHLGTVRVASDTLVATARPCRWQRGSHTGFIAFSATPSGSAIRSGLTPPSFGHAPRQTRPGKPDRRKSHEGSRATRNGRLARVRSRQIRRVVDHEPRTPGPRTRDACGEALDSPA